jgi:hypothetical protein
MWANPARSRQRTVCEAFEREGVTFVDENGERPRRRSGISANGVSLIETGRADPHASTLGAIIAALEAAGVVFGCRA